MAQVVVEGALGDAELRGDLAHGQAPFAVKGFGGARGLLRVGRQALGAPAQAAAGARCGQPRLVPLADQIPLEFRQRGEQVEHQATLGAGGIEGVVEALEPDPLLQQHGGQLDQMAQGAPEAVELPDHQHIVRAQFPEQRREARTLGLGAADHLLVDLRAPGTAQGIHLQVRLWSLVLTRA